MIRFLLVAVVLMFFVVLSVIFYPIGLIIKLFNIHLSRKYAYAYIAVCVKLISFFAGIKCIVIGAKRQIKGKSVLYVSNHRSLQDIIVVFNELNTNACFMVKQSLVNIPVIGWWILMSGSVGVQRDNYKKSMSSLMSACKRVEENESVFIYPESTRNKNKNAEKLLSFKYGFVKIAKRYDCIVQLIAVTHSDCVENHFPKFYKECSTVEFLKPFYFHDLDEENQKNFNIYCANQISKAILKNKEYSYEKFNSNDRSL